MGQVLHGCATATEAVRRAIRHSQESVRALAGRHGINQVEETDVRLRSPTGPKDAGSTVPIVEDKGVIHCFPQAYAFAARQLPLRASAVNSASERSSLHRYLQRHRISRLPQVEGEASPKREVQGLSARQFHVDIAEVRTAEGKLYLLVAIDGTSRFALVELCETVSRRNAAINAKPPRRVPCGVGSHCLGLYAPGARG